MSEIISGVVSDVLEYDEIENHIVPEAALYAIHEGEELAAVDPQPDHWVRQIPRPVDIVADAILGLLPASLQPPAVPTVIAPAGTFSVGQEVILGVEPVIGHDVPAADGDVLVYRHVDRRAVTCSVDGCDEIGTAEVSGDWFCWDHYDEYQAAADGGEQSEVVTLCKGGCRPIWRGSFDECPDCGADTRVTTLEDPEGGPGGDRS